MAAALQGEEQGGAINNKGSLNAYAWQYDDAGTHLRKLRDVGCSSGQVLRGTQALVLRER